jgi:hypothetical protein
VNQNAADANDSASAAICSFKSFDGGESHSISRVLGKFNASVTLLGVAFAPLLRREVQTIVPLN